MFSRLRGSGIGGRGHCRPLLINDTCNGGVAASLLGGGGWAGGGDPQGQEGKPVKLFGFAWGSTRLFQCIEAIFDEIRSCDPRVRPSVGAQRDTLPQALEPRSSAPGVVLAADHNTCLAG